MVWRERRKIVFTEVIATSLCFGRKNLEAKGDLEVEIAKGAEIALEGYHCSELIR